MLQLYFARWGRDEIIFLRRRKTSKDGRNNLLKPKKTSKSSQMSSFFFMARMKMVCMLWAPHFLSPRKLQRALRCLPSFSWSKWKWFACCGPHNIVSYMDILHLSGCHMMKQIVLCMQVVHKTQVSEFQQMGLKGPERKKMRATVSF